jgi:Recombination, repair and ssDNA binding protein UvsY
MKIDEIFEQWEKDSQVDKTELGDASLDTPKLHHKYFQFLVKERLTLRKYETELKQLKLDKYEFLTQGPNEETKDKGWRLPARGMVLKGDIPMYLDADDDIVNLSLKIGLQQEKIELLESIVKIIMNRNYIIRNAIDWQKFTMGA